MKFLVLGGSGTRLYPIPNTESISHMPSSHNPAYLIGHEFIGIDSICIVIGDNIFHGMGFAEFQKNSVMTDELEDKDYYNLQGVPVANPASGPYIRLNNGKAEKIIL